MKKIESYLLSPSSSDKTRSGTECVNWAEKNIGWLEEKPKPIGFTFKGKSKPIEPLQEFRIVLNNKKSYNVPVELNSIIQEIEDSKFIPTLKSDWDNENALPIDEKLYFDVIDFLLEYSTLLFSLHQISIHPPEINPCRDGSIDLSWRTPTVRLIINFKTLNNNTSATFYRDYYNNKNSNKGELILGTIDESFFVWMKLLKQ